MFIFYVEERLMQREYILTGSFLYTRHLLFRSLLIISGPKRNSICTVATPFPLFFFLFPQRTSSPLQEIRRKFTLIESGHNMINHRSREILQGNAEIGQRRFSQSHGTIRKGHGQSRLNPSGLHFLHVITVPKVVFSFLFRQATGFFGNIGAPGQVGAFRFPPWSASRQSQAR